jgi:hypothetical protein
VIRVFLLSPAWETQVWVERYAVTVALWETQVDLPDAPAEAGDLTPYLAAAVVIMLLVLPVIHPQPHLRKETTVETDKNWMELQELAVAEVAQLQ